MTHDFTMSLNWEIYAKDPMLARLEEYDQKLKFAVWEFMECLGEELECDNPNDTIELIKKSIDQFISEYSPMDESFDEYYDEPEGESEDE